MANHASIIFGIIGNPFCTSIIENNRLKNGTNGLKKLITSITERLNDNINWHSNATIASACHLNVLNSEAVCKLRSFIEATIKSCCREGVFPAFFDRQKYIFILSIMLQYTSYHGEDTFLFVQFFFLIEHWEQ